MFAHVQSLWTRCFRQTAYQSESSEVLGNNTAQILAKVVESFDDISYSLVSHTTVGGCR